jgi:predicted transcriptional regulator
MGVFDAVFASAVRQSVLLELHERPRQRRALLDDVDASKSAVYDALNELREYDLLREGRTRRWETTGLGDVVADYVVERQRASDVIDTHRSFWASHDPGVLPAPFRDSLGALADGTHIAPADTDESNAGDAAVETIATTIERASHVALLAPTYPARYARAIERAADTTPHPESSDAADVRLVLARDALTDADAADAPDVPTHVAEETPGTSATVRVDDPEFFLLVTDATLVLGLPPDGDDTTADPNPDAYLRVDTPRARDWGTRVFEHCWRDATPLASVPAIDT